MKVMDAKECRINVFTPLHIGCGEVYEPFSFTLNKASKEILIFNMDVFFEVIDPQLKLEFSTICKKGTTDSLLEMYRFFKRIGERKDIIGKENLISRRIPVAVGFIEHYNEVTGGGSRPNQGSRQNFAGRSSAPSPQRIITNFTISRTAFNPHGKEMPIIPGSSIKGAIRTAVLNLWRDRVRGKRYDDKKNRYLESDILQGSFHTDPFSLLKVSDFLPVGEPKMKVVYGVNVKKKSGSRARGPYQIMEVVLEGEFRGSISILRADSSRGIKQPLSFEILEKALKGFYGKELKREQDELKSSGINFSLQPSQSGMVIRIGRHSGAECVTIEGFRRIKIMGSNNILDHATTIWLASDNRRQPVGAKPFGWCGLSWS